MLRKINNTLDNDPTILKTRMDGEKQICIMKFLLVGFLVIMIIFAALGFARSDFIIILSESISAFLALSTSAFLFIYFKKKNKYPRFIGYIVSTLDMIMISLPMFAVSYGYPSIAVTTGIAWIYPIFVAISARRYSLRISLYTGILGLFLYSLIVIPITTPLFPPKYTYPDGTYEYDNTDRLKILSARNEEIYVGYSVLDVYIKGSVILFSGIIAGLIGNSMKKKIYETVKLAKEQKELREKLQSSITLSVESSSKTSETISTSFSQISASTSEMIATLKNISNNASEQVNAVSISIKHINNIINAFEEIDKSVKEQLAFIQSVGHKSNRLTQGIRKVYELSSNTKNDLTQLVSLTGEGKTAIEKNLNAITLISESAKDIMNLNKEINEISDNTNVLSINASIESVNAGKTGAGFTVVANEVRILAVKTAEATRKINLAINEILNRIKEGELSSEKVSTIFNEITINTQKSDEQVAQITNTTEEQYASTKEIDEFIEQIMTKMHNIANKVSTEKNSSRNILEESNRIKDLATNTSNSIQEQTNVGEDILQSTIAISDVIEENKELSKNMKEILNSSKKDETNFLSDSNSLT